MAFLRSLPLAVVVLGLFSAIGCRESPAPAGAASAEAQPAAASSAGSLRAPPAAAASAGASAPDQPPSREARREGDDAGPAGLAAALGSVDLRAAPALRADAGTLDALRAIFDGYGFPGAPGLTPLCAQRVYQPGAGGHVTWDAIASEEAPATLVERYRARLGEKGFEAVGEGGRWRLPPGAPVPQRSLEILAPSAQGPHRTCDREPPATTQAILVLSREG